MEGVRLVNVPKFDVSVMTMVCGKKLADAYWATSDLWLYRAAEIR